MLDILKSLLLTGFSLLNTHRELAIENLALRHQLESLLRREGSLSTVTNVRGDVAERLGAIHLRDDTLTVVHDLETGLAVLTGSGDMDPMGSGIQAILNELGECFARVRLAESQPPYELEGIMDTELSLFRVRRVFFPFPAAFAFLFHHLRDQFRARQ